MTEREIFDSIIEMLKGGNGFALVLWFAFLTKKYILNGNISRFWDEKEREITALENLEKGLLRVIERQEELERIVKESEKR